MTERGRTESVFYRAKSSVDESSGRGQATSIPISMSRGVKMTARGRTESVFYSVNSSVGESSKVVNRLGS